MLEVWDRVSAQVRTLNLTQRVQASMFITRVVFQHKLIVLRLHRSTFNTINALKEWTMAHVLWTKIGWSNWHTLPSSTRPRQRRAKTRKLPTEQGVTHSSTWRKKSLTRSNPCHLAVTLQLYKGTQSQPTSGGDFLTAEDGWLQQLFIELPVTFKWLVSRLRSISKGAFPLVLYYNLSCLLHRMSERMNVNGLDDSLLKNY
jgi:hypothetical protein